MQRLYNREENKGFVPFFGESESKFKGTAVYLRNDARNDHVSKCFKIINEGNNAKGYGCFNYFWAYFTVVGVYNC